MAMVDGLAENGSAEPSTPARSIGRFRLIRQIGSGGAAEVFLGVARGPVGFNKLVVLKTPRPGSDGRSGFLHEARIAARLSHPNCAQVIGVEEIDGVPVIVFEYLEGCTLAAMRRDTEGKLPLAVEVSVLIGMLRGLHHAHELVDFDGVPLDIVHRDVSPQNVMVTYDGQVKLLDFGIAKVNRQTEQTEVGVIKGKLRYMAPEQLVGGPMDARTDLFAAGVVLWEALAQRRLWAGLSESELLQHAMLGELPKLSEVAPNAPALLRSICERATATELDERFPSAEAMASALEQARDELGLSADADDLIKHLDTRFSDVRLAVRREIEHELSSAAFRSDDEDRTSVKQARAKENAVSIAPELNPEGAVAEALRDTSDAPPTAAPPTSLEPEAAPPRHGGMLLAGIVGFLLCAVVLLAAARFTGHDPAAAPAAASQPPSAPAAASPPPPAREPEPQVAEPQLPAANAAPSASVSPTPAIRASGAPLPAAPQRKAEVATPPADAAPAPQASASAQAPRPSCETPYEITADGFKRYKVECLAESK